MSRNGTAHTDINTDREARLQSVLDDARSFVSSVEQRLVLAGGIAQGGPRTPAELIWRLLLAQTLLLTRSLDASMKLLAEAREDVVELSPTP